MSKANFGNGWSIAEKKFYLGGTGPGPAGVPKTVGWATDWVNANDATPPITDGNWHHVVVTFNRSDAPEYSPGRLYVDGIEVPGYSANNYNGRPDNAGDVFTIGRSPGGVSWRQEKESVRGAGDFC